MTDTVEKKVKKRADYTEGSIIQSILKMGIPSMIGFMANHIYHLVDMWWLAHLPEKETAVAAVTIFANISWVFFSFNSLVGPGSVAVISRRYGEKDYDRAEAAIKETFILKWIIGMILGLAGYLLIDKIVYFAGARGETIGLCISYGQIFFLGMGFSMATYSVYTAMRGVANPHMAMGIMLGSTVLNLLLDPVFIFGYFGFPRMGVAGAAFASILSYTLTFTIGVAIFYAGGTNIKLHLRGKVPMSLKTAFKIVRIGIPMWLGEMSFSGSRLLIMPMIAIFGNSVVAAYGVGMNVSAIGISILVGIGLGLASLIGHNLGGNKKERAKKTADQAILLALGIMVAIGLIVVTLARQILGLYFDNPETIAYGVTLMRIIALGFPFIGAYIMIEEIYTGVGKNSPAMIANTLQAWTLQILPIYVLTKVFHFDQNAVWWTMAASSMIAATGLYLYYRRGQWLHVKV
jgi:putative MATE family efflux protein